jgi:hypothetical protein
LKLTDPLQALDFFRAFMERSLLQHELKGSEREGRRPVVVLIDDSDSMDGALDFAKATALALADLALADKRACRLVRFSHRINGVLDIRPGNDGTRELLTFLAANVDGGTNFELPLRSARDAIENEPVYERADVVLITDGEAQLSEEFRGEWQRRARKEGLTTYAVHIGAHAPKVLRGSHGPRHRASIADARAPRGDALRADPRLTAERCDQRKGAHPSPRLAVRGRVIEMRRSRSARRCRSHAGRGLDQSRGA